MEATLDAETRDTRGKNAANRLRASGRIPAVVYGAGGGPAADSSRAVSVDPKALLRILRSDSGANTLISLSLDGAESRVMIREYQLDPVTHRLLHADFYQLAMDKPITVTVPVQVQGEAPGVKTQGGMLDFVTREIEIECLPTEIPEHIVVDVSNMMLNDAFRVRDLAADSKWTPVSEGDTMLVHIVMPKAEASAASAAEEAAAAAVPAAGAEPEVIKKGKGEEGE